jgi:starch-binding outer membrane protein, SusD/RagB family
MNKYKKITWSFLLIALPILFMASGCKKFLDRKPLTATLDDIKQGGIESLVFGIYGSIGGYGQPGEGFSGLQWISMHNIRSDDAEKGSYAADQADMITIYDQFNYSKDFWLSNGYWDGHYGIIHLANTALQTADSLKLDGVDSRANIAEARFFRAFAYFDLVRVFGEVPKIDFRIYNAAQANKPKAPIAEIYALIEADAQYAIAHLPVSWGNKYPGRLTSGAARTLLAKAHLYRGNFGAALPLCQQVIASNQYSLYSSYYGIFKETGENCSESILEWQFYMGPNRTDDHGSWFGCVQGVRGSNASGWNLGWGFNVPTDDFVNSFESGDPRKGSTVLFSGQSDDPATGGYGKTLPAWEGATPPGTMFCKYYNKKVYADPAVHQSTGWADGAYWVNQRIYRYADVLLMTAECLNETGAGISAAQLVNQVRARVGLSPITFTTQAAMRTAIKKERRSELGLEGERFFDLVRWGDAISVLGPLGYTNRCRFYPIPQGAIDRSNNVLVQNPEW